MGLVYNENMSEALAVLAQLVPGSQAAGSVTIGPFNMAGVGRAILNLQSATLSGGSTVAVQAKQSTTQGGTYTNIAGASASVAAGANQVTQVEVRAESLGAGGPWVEFVVTVAVAAATLAGVVLGGVTAFDPSSDYNIANVAAPVVV